MRHPLIVTTIVLLVTALVLGYAIYIKSFKPNSPKISIPSPTAQVANPPQATGSARFKTPPWVESLSETERSLFNNVPKSNPSQEEKQQFRKLVAANARRASELTIAKDCQPSPIDLAVDQTLSFKIKNIDTVTHTLKIGAAQYPVAPGESSIVKLEKADTIRPFYGCDSYTLVGFFVPVAQP